MRVVAAMSGGVDSAVAAQLGMRADRTAAAALLSGKGYLPQPQTTHMADSSGYR